MLFNRRNTSRSQDSPGRRHNGHGVGNGHGHRRNGGHPVPTNILCQRGPGHELPVAMTPIGQTRTASGGTAAVIACPICNRRELWARDYITGKPRRIHVQPAA